MMSQNNAPKSAPSFRQYKEFGEGRAKALYEQMFLQYLQSGKAEEEASSLARSVIRKQCEIRNVKPWPWV